MSGEILFVDGPGGSASRLVGALQILEKEVPGTEFAIIGGLAVMTRLGRVHRATDDLDAAAQSVDGGPSRLSVLVGGDSGRAQRLVEGVKVDCIDVGSTSAADLDPGTLPEDQFDRAFILARRWALDSATPVSLTVASAERVPLATATCRVATPSTLVAMKLQSAPRRRAERAHKGPNDYGDLYALLTQTVALDEIATILPNAPRGLGRWCAQRIELEFVTGAAQTARAIRQTMLSDPPTPEDIERAGRAALRRIDPH